MSKNRRISTRMWRDEYFSRLDPSEKLLFVYCLTSPDTSLCGIYEIPVRIIAADTGLDSEMIKRIFTRFETDGKVIYRDGWIAIKNFMKYQNYNLPMQKSAEEDLNYVPSALKDWIFHDDGMMTSSCGHDAVIPHININRDIDIDKDKDNNAAKFKKPTIQEIQDYLNEKTIKDIDPERFWNYYESNGWRVGRNPMKSWRAAISTWRKNGYSNNAGLPRLSETTKAALRFSARKD